MKLLFWMATVMIWVQMIMAIRYSRSGFQWLNSFRKDFFPEWIYEIPGIRIRKTITMVNGENTTLIRYEVLKAAKFI